MTPGRWLCVLPLIVGTVRLGFSQTPRPRSDTTVTTGDSVAEIGNRPGRAAPDFKLKTIDGREARLSELKGRPVVLMFWATWCSPCRIEVPEVVAQHRAHKDEGLEVFAVNSTDQESMKDVRKFIAEFPMPFPVLLDKRGRARELYELIALPTTVFIGRDGVVRLVNSGPMTATVLERGVAMILERSHEPGSP